MLLNINPEHPFYRPLWVRIMLVGVIAAWGLMEFTHHAYFWGTIAVGLDLFVIYELFWRYEAHRKAADEKKLAADLKDQG